MNNMTCCNCGIAYSVPDRWCRERENDHKTFYCPNGHRQYFSGESSEEKLRRRAERAEQQNAMLSDERDAAERSARAFKGQATKLRNRAKAGVCPCCKRTFGNVARHMKQQHPTFGENVVTLKTGTR